MHACVSIVFVSATWCTGERYLTAPSPRPSVYCLCQCGSVNLAKVPHDTTLTVKCLLSMTVRLG
ncbi:hypothetical protein DPMN_062531 [Dreissena polymorpha]|uniref:Secreted protein n=1 Tax=Dreissena polymorpha TaxID=45954 RepID=A0A9D4C9M2_DREPO|nr:hypothetical protein DPMN_062531 [Dreissena polymorpha]